MNYETTHKEKIPRTLDAHPKASRQAVISDILQAYTRSADDKCLQREALASGGVLNGNVTYTKRLNKGKLSAWNMEATNIEFSSPFCFQLPVGNTPSVNPPGWDRVAGCVRMHLLNAELGGTGANTKNLAPGSYALNNAHKNEVEKILLSHVRDKRGKINNYSVECTYETGLGDLDYTLKQINCKYDLDNGQSDDVDIID